MESSIKMENQEKSRRNFISFTWTFEDKVLVAVALSLLSILVSIFLNYFVRPPWANEVIASNEQLKSKINKETLILIGGGTIHEYFHE